MMGSAETRPLLDEFSPLVERKRTAPALSRVSLLEKLNSGLKSDIRCDMRLIAQDRSQQHGIRLISA